MSTIAHPVALPTREDLPLENGDRMTQQEFHAAYLQAPAGLKAELIGGIVYVASPLAHRHARAHPPLSTAFYYYEMVTPGTECGDNGTVLLGEDSEPQPDLYLMLLPEVGGQAHVNARGFVRGAPELVAEIALSSRSIDLHGKRKDYQRYGVKEYLVYSIRDGRLRWFDLARDEELQGDADGVLRLRTFPGLWLSAEAVAHRDGARLLTTLQQGIASTEHAAFVAELARRRAANGSA